MPSPSEEPDDFTKVRHYWEELPFDRRTYYDLALELGKSPEEAKKKPLQNQLGRLIKQWEAGGLVRHQVFPNSSHKAAQFLPRDTVLEEALRTQYGLRGTVVVMSSSIRPRYPYEDNPLGWNRYDDELHVHLGRWAGRVLTAILRPDDTLGLGGGRGPFYTIKNSSASSGSRYSFKKAVSLTGQMLAYIWAPNRQEIPADLDADRIAQLASGQLGAAEAARLIQLSIVVDSGATNRINVDDVTIAVVGCGSLAGGHRLREYGNNHDLHNVRGDLQKLNDHVNKIDPPVRGNGPFPHWVGDITNHLFVIEPEIVGIKLKSDKLEAYKNVRDIVDKLNKRFLNVSLADDLPRICGKGGVIAVAGGPHKVTALHQVLELGRMGKPRITHLVTDDFVASAIMNRVRDSATPSDRVDEAMSESKLAPRRSRGR